MRTLKPFLVHLIPLGVFIALSLGYFYPVLSGKAIFQSDIAQFKGMQRQVLEHRAAFDEEPYWIDNAFGGMPTYQIVSKHAFDLVGHLDSLIRFLPRPADYLFVYLVGFYFLALFFKVSKSTAVMGAVAFGFSTYLIIILGVGHNTKALAIGYMPWVVLGVLYLLHHQSRKGIPITIVATALQLHANHYQMTYYMLWLIGVVILVYGYQHLKQKSPILFLKSLGLVTLSMCLALTFNATHLLATKEYSVQSTRGENPLKTDPNGLPLAQNDGLTYDYITEYSYGILESINLLIPRFMGGGSGDRLGSDSKLMDFLQEIDSESAQQIYRYASLYWGDQPIVEAPAYVGAVVFFLAVFGFLAMHKRWRTILLTATLISLFFSWGKNADLLTRILIEYVPFYNKFRAVSSAQVILEFCMPLAAVLGVHSLFDKEKRPQVNRLLSKAFFMVISLIALVLLATFIFLDFQSAREVFAAYPEIMTPLIQDRKALLLQDLLRTTVFVSFAYLLCRFGISTRYRSYVVPMLTLLLLLDLWSFSRNYVNEDDFVSKSRIEKPFMPNTADVAIQRDSTRFRVFEPQLGMAHARTAYFHHTLGGYHGAKPRRMQDLYDFHVSKGHQQVLNMLNVKYIIQDQEDNPLGVVRNPNPYGNAWLVNQVIYVDSADEEISRLPNETLQSVALTTEILPQYVFEIDDSASVELSSYKANALVYDYIASKTQFVVFSEMHYPHGWQAKIDGQEVPHYRVNYALRGLIVPAGSHEISFEFAPEVIETGNQIRFAGYGVFAMLMLFLYGRPLISKNKFHSSG
ncbi:MAG: YfhO family protein [Flavobacteriaceae bacterium]